MTREGKYYYFTKHYCHKDQNSLIKKQCIKGGESKNLTYQLSWIKNKPWHVYNKVLQGGLCTVFVLFDQNSGSKPRGKIVKNVFQDVGKSEKITKHETKEYHDDVLGKAKQS